MAKKKRSKKRITPAERARRRIARARSTGGWLRRPWGDLVKPGESGYNDPNNK